MAHVLIVDDERSMREFLEVFFARLGHSTVVAADALDAVARLNDTKTKSVDLVLTDLRLPKGSGMDVLGYVAKNMPGTQVIIMTAFATTENAVEAMKKGAYDYILKPFKLDELTVVVDRALERQSLKAENTKLRATLDARSAQSRLIGASPAMREVFDLIGKVAPGRTTILLTGESGTGKELVARAIHSRGPRAAEPFVPINCGAIPETLIESELFGHTKGSFTGAHVDKAGLFELAGKGSVFLDEIGELPLAMQVRLLRVLQERNVRRVGGMEDHPLECRVIAATNRDLRVEVERGRFREDLFFRLNVIQIPLPSLRQRRADIPMLAEAFLHKFAEEQGSDVRQIHDDAMIRLAAYHWPGNIRELENVVERGVTLAAGPILGLAELPASVLEAQPRATDTLGDFLVDIPPDGLNLEENLERFERRLLEQALVRTDGKKKRAAALLGLSFRSFRYRVAKLGIAASDDDNALDDDPAESAVVDKSG